MAMREARLEVDGEPVAEGEAGVLRVRAVWVVRVRRNETARTTRGCQTAVESREWGTNDAAPCARATHS